MKNIKILKIVAIISGFLAILQFLYPFVLKIILKYMLNRDIGNPNTDSSIGIIGSSDGPTAIFIAHSSNIISLILKYSFMIICAIIAFLSILMIKNKK